MRADPELRHIPVIFMTAKANPEDTGYELVESIIGSLCIFGNAYLYLETQGTSQVTELKVLGGGDVSPIPGPRGTVAAYEYRPLGTFGAERRVLSPESVLHFRDYNPFADGLGLSPLHAAQLAYETERDRDRYQRQFYAGGAQVAGTYATPEQMEEFEIKRIQDGLMQQAASIENMQRPVILTGGLSYVRAGLTQTEMKFIESAKLTEADIMKIFRIPPVLMGVKEGGGLSDAGAQTDMLLFWEQCIKPRLRRVEAVLNEKLVPRFGGGDMQCEFNLAKVAVYQEVFLDQAKAYAEATGGPVMSRAEARERLDLPEMPEEELDKVLAPTNLVPVGTEPLAGTQAKDGPNGGDAGQGDVPPVEDTSYAAKYSAINRGVQRRAARAGLLRYERMFIALVRKFFNDQEARFMNRLAAAAADAVSSRLTSHWTPAEVSVKHLRDPEASRAFVRALDLDELLVDDEVDRRLVRDLLRAILQERGQEVIDELASQVVFSSFSQRAEDFVVRKGVRLVTYLNNTTRKELREALLEAIDRHEGYAEVVARVREVFGGRRANAATIARTETAAAYNYASVEAYEQSGVVEEKEWLTAQDDAVREAHAEIDGQVVGLDETFTMTGDDGGLYDAEFPGDPALPPDLSINCRCTVLPVLSKTRSAPEPSTNGHHRVVSLEEMFK